jgi:hypothetical protein
LAIFSEAAIAWYVGQPIFFYLNYVLKTKAEIHPGLEFGLGVADSSGR